MSKMEPATNSTNQNSYLGMSETLLIFKQQHNIKEEQILYPMIDQECANKVEELTRNIINY